MTTAQQVPENIRKLAVYDADGNILLRESLERLEAQFGGTGVITKKKGGRDRVKNPSVPVVDTVTGATWESQSQCAGKLFPEIKKLPGNGWLISDIYRNFPGRFAIVKNGKQIPQYDYATPVKPAVAKAPKMRLDLPDQPSIYYTTIAVAPTTTAETSAESK